MKKNETSLALITGLLSVGISLPTMAQEVEIQEGTVESEIIAEENLPTEMPVPVEMIEVPQEPDGQVVQVNTPIPQVIETEKVEIAPKIEPQKIENPAPSKNEATYTWADFVLGKHCTSGDTFGIDNSEITTLIFSYCNYPKGDAWQKWLNSFRSAKKDFLVQQDMKETNLFIRYLKVVPHLLFEVHNTQNKNNDTLGKLDQIESFILKRNTNEAIEFIQSIQNDSLRLALQPVLTEGKNLLKIQNELEKITGEANND